MIRKNNKLCISEKNDEIIVMNLEQGMFFGLQDVSFDIWKSLDECKNIDEIANYIVERYKVSYDEVIDDVEIIIKEMNKNGMVIVE